MLKRDAYPAGGHHEVDIGPDGKLLGVRDFSKSCLTLDSPVDTKGLWMTHLLDPHPTEMHVYLSLWSGQPVFVGTSDDVVWSVNGTRIDKVDPKKGGAKKK